MTFNSITMVRSVKLVLPSPRPLCTRVDVDGCCAYSCCGDDTMDVVMDVDVMGLVVNAYDGSYGGCCCCDAMLAIAAAVRGV